MIANQTVGKDIRGCLDYVLKKEGAKLIGGNIPAGDVESIAKTFNEVKPKRSCAFMVVYHASLSVKPTEEITDKKWCKVASDFLKGMGYVDNQYVVVKHNDTDHNHIHIIANACKSTGRLVPTSQNYSRGKKVVADLEKKYHLERTHIKEQLRKPPTTGEIRMKRRTGEMLPRDYICDAIDEIAKLKLNMPEFLDTVKEKGIEVKLSSHSDKKGRETIGISYSYKGIAFAGRRLGSAYTFNGLQKHHRVGYERERDYDNLFRDEPLPQKPENTDNQAYDTPASSSSRTDNPEASYNEASLKLLGKPQSKSDSPHIEKHIYPLPYDPEASYNLALEKLLGKPQSKSDSPHIEKHPRPQTDDPVAIHYEASLTLQDKPDSPTDSPPSSPHTEAPSAAILYDPEAVYNQALKLLLGKPQSKSDSPTTKEELAAIPDDPVTNNRTLKVLPQNIDSNLLDESPPPQPQQHSEDRSRVVAQKSPPHPLESFETESEDFIEVVEHFSPAQTSIEEDHQFIQDAFSILFHDGIDTENGTFSEGENYSILLREGALKVFSGQAEILHYDCDRDQVLSSKVGSEDRDVFRQTAIEFTQNLLKYNKHSKLAR